MSIDSATAWSVLRLSAVASIAFFGTEHQTHAQNLVLNPGFEATVSSGNGTATQTPNWILGSGGGTFFSTNPAGQGSSGPNSGSWYAVFSATSANQATASTLSQTITTTPSTTYIVSFFLSNLGGPHDTFLATFGGQTVLSLSDSAAFGYRRYTATITATSAQTVLAFTGEQDPAQFGLDDVSVVAEAAPAPVTGGGIASICVLVAALSIQRMRRRKV
jgi:hypothetical protein